MAESESNQKPTGWLNTLLESPFLFTALLIVFGVFVVLVGLVSFPLRRPADPAGNPTPLPPSNVGFATPTAVAGATPTPAPAGPSVALLPVRGEAGTLVTITGKNWTPNDTVVVRLDDPTGGQTVQPLFTNVQVAGNGTFIASFILQKNTGWDNLNNVLVTVESTPAGQQVSAQYSIIPPASGQTPIPTPTAPPDTTPTHTVTPPPPGSTPTPTTQFVSSPGDWSAQYYSNPNLVGAPALVRNELGIDFDWAGSAPAPNLPSDGFSVRWLRTYNLSPGVYRFHILADDGVRLWVNEKLIADEWYTSAPREIIVDFPVSYGGLQDIRLEYADFTAGSKIRFWWEKLAQPPPGGDRPPFNEWRSRYWPNVNLFGDPLIVGTDPAVNFDWGTGAPASGMPSDNFSARWVRLADFEGTNYRFYITVNDGARLWIDGQLLIDEWRDGDTREVSKDLLMTSGRHELRLEYYDRTGPATIKLRWEKTPAATTTPTPTATPIGYYPDWRAEYWSNLNLTGSPTLVRNDPQINFNWGSGAADPSLPADNFSVRWSRSFNFENGLYRFTAQINDGIRFYVDGTLMLDQWADTAGTKTYTVDLNLNGRHWLVVEYYDHLGEAVASFRWEQIPVTPTLTPTPTPTSTSTPTATATTPPPTATPTATLPPPTNTATATQTSTPTTTTPMLTPTTPTTGTIILPSPSATGTGP